MPVDIRLNKEDMSEALRYMEYGGQELDKELEKQLIFGMEAVNAAARPVYVLKEFELGNGEFPPELSFLTGNDIRRHTKGCKRVLCMAATLGSGIDMGIRRAQIRNVTDALIMDSFASVLIETLCDSIEAEERKRLAAERLYLTGRYSPGYGDLPIGVQREFAAVLNTARLIGLGVSESGIMIPRKSVTAILGISDRPVVKRKRSCAQCNMLQACRFRRRGVRCGE